MKGVLDQILADVAKTADDLEESLNQNLFDAALEDVSVRNFVSILCTFFVE